VIAGEQTPGDAARDAHDAAGAIDGSSPLSARRRFLRRSHHNMVPWMVGAIVALVVIWLVTAAVLGMRP
jgi:hypothetical protein